MTSVACEVCGKVFDGMGPKAKKCMSHVASHIRIIHPLHWAATESVRKERTKEHNKHRLEELRKTNAAKKQKREDDNHKRLIQKRTVDAAAAARAAAEAEAVAADAHEQQFFLDNLWADV